MQSFLAKCAACGIVVGGFALTGDLGRLADRGRQLIEATGVPSARAADEEVPAAAKPPAVTDQTAAASALPVTAEPAGAPRPPTEVLKPASPWRLPGDPPADAPVGRPASIAIPDSGGLETVELGRLSPGSRILVWVRSEAQLQGGRLGTELFAFDVIDPTSGAALEHRHAAVAATGREPVHAAPRRVIIAAGPTGRLGRNETLRVAPLRGIHGLGREEAVGRVLALDVKTP